MPVLTNSNTIPEAPQAKHRWPLHALGIYRGYRKIMKVRIRDYVTLRVQVPNNHILTQNLYYNHYYPKPKVPNYWVLGPSGLGSF